MHATARALVKAALLQKHPDAGAAELKRLLFLHFYGADFERKERKRIVSALSKTGRSSKAPGAHVREVGTRAVEGKRRMQVTESPATYRTRRLANRKK
jgi:hypothetical protein